MATWPRPTCTLHKQTHTHTQKTDCALQLTTYATYNSLFTWQLFLASLPPVTVEQAVGHTEQNKSNTHTYINTHSSHRSMTQVAAFVCNDIVNDENATEYPFILLSHCHFVSIARILVTFCIVILLFFLFSLCRLYSCPSNTFSLLLYLLTIHPLYRGQFVQFTLNTKYTKCSPQGHMPKSTGRRLDRWTCKWTRSNENYFSSSPVTQVNLIPQNQKLISIWPVHYSSSFLYK